MGCGTARAAFSAWPAWRVVTLALVGTCACSAVHGLESVPDALSGDQASGIEGPGLQLARGHFARLSDAGNLLFARNTDSTSDEVVVVDRTSHTECRIDHATWIAYYGDPWIAYQTADELQDGRGPVHFTDLNCQPLAFQLDRGRLPFSVQSGQALTEVENELVEVAPLTGSVHSLAADVSDIRFNYKAGSSGVWAVVSSGELALFDGDNNALARIGSGMVRVAALDDGFIMEDAGGVHRVTIESDDTTSDDVLDADACGLSLTSSGWLLFYSPCADRIAHGLVNGRDVTFGANVPLEHSELELIQAPTANLNFARLFFVRDLDASGLGTLWSVDAPFSDDADPGAAASAPVQLAERADPNFLPSQTTAYAALVNVSNGAGQLLYQRNDGSSLLLEGSVLGRRITSYSPASPWFLMNSDGTSATLVSSCSSCNPPRTFAVAQGVPLSGLSSPFYAQGEIDWAVLTDFDGVTGTVKRRGDQVLATGVPAGQFQGPSFLASGLVYLTQYDANSGTGELQYLNQDLDVRARIASGISEFQIVNLPHPGVAYASQGTNAGLWFAPAK